MEIRPIGYIKTDFDEKFGIPRQSGRVKTYGEIMFYPEYRDENAIRGIEGFDYIWLLFDFSEARGAKLSPMVRPPKLGGNKKVGVYASRSPFRPNFIGLSSVRLVGINDTAQGKTLLVEGADLLNGTPIYDIKPYLKSDCHIGAKYGYAEEAETEKLKVEFPSILRKMFSEEKAEELIGCLAEDPRPGYADDGKEYGMKFCGRNVKFSVSDGVITVIDIAPKAQ